MGKELVIASNRHETKVAILEDDQLVEIYFQRANEYSLAGSIHKGRVTRVLPGMQSAFVDLGLERDTFLYVSDFFEENEEYDRIGGTGEERGRVERPQLMAVPPVVVTEAPVVLSAVEPSENPPAAEAASPDDEGDPRDRRNRRSRRRRNRGRGFPDSKYASDVVAEPKTEEVEPPLAPAESDEEFPVLPGESLAKYSHSEAEPAVGEAPAEAEPPDAAPEAGPGEDGAAEEDAPEVRVVESPVAEARPPVLEDELSELREELMDADLEAPVTGEPQLPAGEAETAAEEPASEETVAEVAGEASEPEAVEPEATGAGALASDDVEPARMPQSLTATLREQGQSSRYLHRGSRRMRRKMRTAGNGEPRPEQERPEMARPEPAREVKPEQKIVSRSERGTPSITDLLREGQEIIVQIAKEPLGQKGARITSHIALPGRYVVYMPTLEHMGVSRKIESDEERLRLKRILQGHRAGTPGGFIVRTAGGGRSESEIAADMEFLFNLWLDIRQKAEKTAAPALLHHDLEIVQRLLRDQLTENFKAIWTDSEELYESVLRFVQRFQPALVSRIKLYTRPTPIFDAFNITSELEKALRPKVWLKSGGYIVINQTEALVAIDVNTGKFVGKSNRLEDTIVKTNTEAVKEIVRQMRLRDLGGIIVIDFIDMDERKNRQKVMQALEEAMQADRAPYKILQFNDFGLVAITRKRVKQSLERTLCSPCPYCDGAGYVKSVQTVIGEILQEAAKLVKAAEGENMVLRVNPDVAKVLKSTENKYLEELEGILGRPVLVTSDPLLHQEKFDLA